MKSVLGAMPYKKTIISMLLVHIIAFVPFIGAAMLNSPDFIHLLTLPALTGVITLITSIVLVIISLKRVRESKLEKSLTA